MSLSYKNISLYLHICSICCHVLHQIRNHVTFRLKFTGIKRYSTCRLRPKGKCVVNIVFVKAGFLNFFRSEISCQLVYDGADHLKVCKFICALMLDIIKGATSLQGLWEYQSMFHDVRHLPFALVSRGCM